MRPGELAPALILFAWCFCVVGAFFVGRAVRDALFLAHLSASELPWMYIASPLAMSVLGLGYARIADRVPRDRLVIASALVLAALTVAAYLAIGAGNWVYYAIYVFVNLMGGLAVMQFWTVAGDRFHTHEAKRLFGLIAAGGTLANIALGLSVSAMVDGLGTERMLLVCAALLVAAGALAAILYRLPGTPAPVTRRRSGVPDAPRVVGLPPGARHLRLAAIVIAATVLAVTLGDYAFKALTASALGDDRGAMVRYFGLLSAGTGILSLLIQITLTGWLLARAGVAGALAVLPLFLAGGFAAVVIAPSLITATLLRGADTTFRYTVNDAAMQLLYLPLAPGARGRFKALLEAVIKPGAELATGLALLAYGAISSALEPVAVAGIAAALLWLAALARMRAAYSAALADTLRARRLELEGGGSVPEEELRVVRAGLASGDPAIAQHALELARAAAPALHRDAAPLLTHDSPAIRRTACQVLGRSAERAHREALRFRLDDRDLDVRIAAAAALVRLEGDDADAARLIALIESSDPAVARAAARAAADAADRRLGPALAAALERPGAGPVIADALAACGPGVEDLAGAVLWRRGSSHEAAHLAARALGRLATPAAARVLVSALDFRDERVRGEAARALARLAAEAPDVPVDRARITAACERELAIAYRALAAAEGLGRIEVAARGARLSMPFAPGRPEGAAALVAKALRERTERARDRAFALLAALHPGRAIARAYENLREPSPARRANAIELLDSTLREPVRSLVVPLVDDSPRDAKLSAVEGRIDLPRWSRERWLAALLADPSPWMLACAAYYAGVLGVGAMRERLRELTSHSDAIVRETAAAALDRLARVSEAAAHA